MSASGFRPPNWGSQPQLYSMTCTLPQGESTTYYFDATLRVDHVQEAIGTEHPVQVGSAVIDHVYLRPARVTLEVAISDALQSYENGQYSGNSRSVAAYQKFKEIQAARVPITLATRLDSYENMWLEFVRGTETRETFGAFRGVLSFKQIISATVAEQDVSSRPNTTNSTNEGTKGPETVPPEIQTDLNSIQLLPSH